MKMVKTTLQKFGLTPGTAVWQLNQQNSWVSYICQAVTEIGYTFYSTPGIMLFDRPALIFERGKYNDHQLLSEAQETWDEPDYKIMLVAKKI